MSQKEDQQQLDTFPRLLNCIISLVRYPKTINETDLAEFADTLMQVRPLLTPYPESTSQCIEVAEKIYEIIKKYLKGEEKQKQKQKESASGQGDPQGDQQDPSD